MSGNIADQLIRSTIRITAFNEGDKTVSNGSGFFYHYITKEKARIPVIVTNRHVIEGFEGARVSFPVKKGDGLIMSKEAMFLNLDSIAIIHESSDLAVIPIANIEFQIKNQGFENGHRSFAKANIPTFEQANELTAIEDVLMIGYPNGLADFKNNLPIVRKGITATPYYSNYEGNPEFMIDMACFPGSSGSPIVLMDTYGYHDKQGNLNLGSRRLYLLGILRAGPTVTKHGEIVFTEDPKLPSVRIQDVLNLGICIKARELEYFENVLVNLAESPKKGI